MHVLVFDTETTGLPKTKIINPDTLHLWPHIVQFSFVIYDIETNTIIEVKDYIIKVDKSVIIDDESTKIHGITNEISQVKGIPLEYVLKEFFYYLRNADKLVGHNVSFDINMIKIELLRIIYLHKYKASKMKITEIKTNLHYLTNYKNVVCTLQESIELCDIKAIDKYGKTYTKWPRLLELHQKLFQTTPNNLHNSFNDILVTLRCFVKMKHNTDLNNNCVSFQNISQMIELY